MNCGKISPSFCKIRCYFRITIWYNLKYGNENASDAQVQKAMETSYCEDMLQKLPQGYDTFLVRSGENISQGERQLLAIARAFIADPKILILDEATASLDTETEKDIQDALQKLIAGRTTIAIAHRLSTLRNATRLVVLDHGRVAEVGTHEELLERRGLYYELVMAQRQMSKMPGALETTEQPA